MKRRTKAREEKPAIQGLAAREGALQMISAVLDRGAMADETSLKGDPAIKAEARGLADLTLRRLGQIDAVLAGFVERIPPPPVCHAMRLMAAELLFAGTAPHAAVDLAVRLAKRGRNGGRMGGLVNAVGRRLADQGAAIIAAQDPARLNTPDWFWLLLEADWGATAAHEIAAAHLSPAPHDLTLAAQADASTLAAEIGASLLPTGSLRLDARPQISALPGYKSGAWWAQDAAAALPARLIREPGTKRVLDLCAAPGGKTLQLAATGADVTALDISARRMRRLEQNLIRTGLPATTVVADALGWEPEKLFDAILLDAPCSATGTIRRHPDLLWRQDDIELTALLDLQRKLLDCAAQWLNPGGVLIFCTCSMLKAEGEGQAAEVLVRQPTLEALPIEPGEADIPAEFINDAGDLRTRPDHWHETGGLDGFFAARFRKI